VLTPDTVVDALGNGYTVDHPHIVIHLKNIKSVTGDVAVNMGYKEYMTDAFLTVRNIYVHNTDGSNTLLTAWKPGYIYRIDKIYFGVDGTGTSGNDTPNDPDGPSPGGGSDDPQPVPELGVISVTATATFEPWDDEDTPWSFF
jgi:hypothetical protein